MERSPFLPLPEGMVIGQIEITAARLMVEVISTQPSACCPECGCPSEHVHCQYQRTVHDVPCGGRAVVLRLGVRKFACWTATCPRKVFAERLPDLVQPWARGSLRLLEELKAIGLAASAEVSERLAPRLGMKVKAPTLLRYSSRSASFLMILSPEKLSAKGQQQVEHICQASSDLHMVYLLSQEFVTLLKERQAEALDSWLKRAKEGHVTELSSFVNGIRRDYAAVHAAFSCE